MMLAYAGQKDDLNSGATCLDLYYGCSFQGPDGGDCSRFLRFQAQQRVLHKLMLHSRPV
jgi:hypothetical protein